MELDAQSGARLIDLAGTPEFGPHLLELASSMAGIEEVFGYCVDREGTRPIASASALDGQRRRVQAYAGRFYRQDPAIHQARGENDTRNFSHQVSCKQILQNDYRRICFEEPRLTGKTCFGWRGEDRILLINFYSRAEPRALNLAALSGLANLTLSAASRKLRPRSEAELCDLFELRLYHAYPQLSRRERQVIARTMIGCCSGAIAEKLGTSRGTVLTYRQRAYQRYGFGNAAQFLTKII